MTREKILITGASGLVGKAVWSRLEASDQYDLICWNKNSIKANNKCENFTGSFLSASTQERFFSKYKIDYWLHFAWETRHGYYWNAIENEAWAYFSSQFATRFLKQGGHTAFIAGTCAEYKWTDQLCDTDETPLNNRNLYAASKIFLHSTLERKFYSKSKKLIWGRIFFPYGNGDKSKRLLPHIISKALNDEPIELENPYKSLDFINTELIAEAVFKSLSLPTENHVINLSTGTAVALIDLANIVTKAFNSKSEIIFDKYIKHDHSKVFGDSSVLRNLLNKPDLNGKHEFSKFISTYSPKEGY